MLCVVLNSIFVQIFYSLKYSLIFLFLFQPVFAFCQEHRRDNYFETFVEVKEPIDSIVVFKSAREMQTYHKGVKVKKYMISLGMEPTGRKQFEGDLRTPEGLYCIDQRSTVSSYHTNLGISYPSYSDWLSAAIIGLNAGGDIKIHGFPNNHTKKQERGFLNTDWTIGCIAVSDFEIDELYNWVVYRCPILILP